MANKRVKVPREVAEAIDRLRTLSTSSHGIMRIVEYDPSKPVGRIVYRWAFATSGGGTPDLLMQALVNGYEVERSSEDKLLREFKAINGACTPGTEFGKSAIERRKGFLAALDIVGIKVEGVNA